LKTFLRDANEPLRAASRPLPDPERWAEWERDVADPLESLPMRGILGGSSAARSCADDEYESPLFASGVAAADRGKAPPNDLLGSGEYDLSRCAKGSCISAGEPIGVPNAVLDKDGRERSSSSSRSV
jgi:hypothetical protein